MDLNIDGSELPFVVKMINQMFFPRMREGWEPVRADEYGPEAESIQL